MSSPLYGKNVANVIYYSTGEVSQSLSVAMHYAEQSVDQDPVSQLNIPSRQCTKTGRIEHRGCGIEQLHRRD
jgi:hypothetical protein